MKIEEVKQCLNKPVKYKDAKNNRTVEYLFTGCILRKVGNTFFYQAELQDIKAKKSLMYCKLEDIEKGA